MGASSQDPLTPSDRELLQMILSGQQDLGRRLDLAIRDYLAPLMALIHPPEDQETLRGVLVELMQALKDQSSDLGTLLQTLCAERVAQAAELQQVRVELAEMRASQRAIMAMLKSFQE